MYSKFLYPRCSSTVNFDTFGPVRPLNLIRSGQGSEHGEINT